ncbi:hypothetical protein ABD77_26175 [Brevibacillus formosus]|nr:hypothetical protein [Brevibacillus formosus]
MWHYEKQNIDVAFYYKGGNNPSPDNPKGGVISIVVNEPSDIKTDRGFGIGSILKDVMQSFQSAYAYEKRKDTDTQYVVISGSSSSGNAFYPSLRVLLKKSNHKKECEIPLSKLPVSIVKNSVNSTTWIGITFTGSHVMRFEED